LWAVTYPPSPLLPVRVLCCHSESADRSQVQGVPFPSERLCFLTIGCFFLFAALCGEDWSLVFLYFFLWKQRVLARHRDPAFCNVPLGPPFYFFTVRFPRTSGSLSPTSPSFSLFGLLNPTPSLRESASGASRYIFWLVARQLLHYRGIPCFPRFLPLTWIELIRTLPSLSECAPNIVKRLRASHFFPEVRRTIVARNNIAGFFHLPEQRAPTDVFWILFVVEGRCACTPQKSERSFIFFGLGRDPTGPGFWQ